MLRRINYVLLTIALVLQSIVFYDASSEESRFDIVSLAFWGWLALPFLTMFLANTFFSKTRASRVTLSVGTVIVAVCGTFLIYDAFYVHLDAQSGLVFFFVPFYTLVLSGMTSLIALGLSYVKSSDSV